MMNGLVFVNMVYYLIMITRLRLKSFKLPTRQPYYNPKSYQTPNHTFPTIHPSTTILYNTLSLQLKFNLVNIPIASRYHQAQLPQKVNELLQLLEYQKDMNEKTVLLQCLTDIIVNDPKIILSRDQTARIVRQLKLWSGRKGRFDKVATVVWVIRKLHLQQQLRSLYNEISERFQNDEWYVNFDESLKALQAFTDLPDGQLKNYIYPRIERNISITVWQFNMSVYQRIVVALLQGNRLQSAIWAKLQDHIMKNLGMEYSLKTITDIFTCYALAKQGSDVFFQMIQKAIYLGHWYSYELKHKILPGYDQTGEFYALLVETYSIVKKNCQIELLPNFLEYIYQGVADRKTNYQQLSSFTRLIQHLPGLFEQQDEEEIIGNLLQNKKPTSITYREVIQFHDIMHRKRKVLPLHLHRHIQKVLLSDIRRKLIPSSKVLEISEELLEKGYILEREELFLAIDEALTSNFKYLQGEEARAVFQLSSASKFLPEQIKKTLALPGKVGNTAN